jgi:putative redox protein
MGIRQHLMNGPAGFGFGSGPIGTIFRDVPDAEAAATVDGAWKHGKHYFDTARGSAQWMVGGRTLTLKRAFVEDVRAADLHAKVRRLHLPLLILHSPAATRPVSTTRAISSALHVTRVVSSRSRAPTICSPRPARREGPAE